MVGMGGISARSQHGGKVTTGREPQGDQELMVRMSSLATAEIPICLLSAKPSAKMSTALPVACSLIFANVDESPSDIAWAGGDGRKVGSGKNTDQ